MLNTIAACLLALPASAFVDSNFDFKEAREKGARSSTPTGAPVASPEELAALRGQSKGPEAGVPKDAPEDLKKLLSAVRQDVAKQDWKTYLERISLGTRQHQLAEMRVSKEQLIAESLGLHFVNNSIGELQPDGKVAFDLSRIKSVIFTSFDGKTARGRALVSDGRVLGVLMHLKKDGGWRILAGLG